MLNWLKNLFTSKEDKPFLGVYIPLDKKEDTGIPFSEVVANASSPVWEEKTEDKWRTFPASNQYSSGMCGAFAMALIIGILYFLKYGRWIDFSQAHLFQQRDNRPLSGMWRGNIYSLIEYGITLKILTGENIRTDADADNLVIEQYAKDVAKVFPVGKCIVVPIDIDAIASVIHTTGKPVLLTTYFTSPEWSQKFPKIIDKALSYLSQKALRHYVVAVDAFLFRGVKYILVQDSAWFGGLNKRLLNSEWISTRIYDATYPRNFYFIEGGDKPQYDGTIISVQKCLKYLGFFPDGIPFAENVGKVTQGALIKFQTKYGIIVSGRLCDETRAKLLSLFN